MSNRYNRYDLNLDDESFADDLPGVQLIVRRGETRRRVRPVTGPVYTMGTSEECDLLLGDQQFAELHCYLCVREGRVSLRQVSAAPLITVNGRELRWGELAHGDRIRTGPYEFQLQIGELTAAYGAGGADSDLAVPTDWDWLDATPKFYDSQDNDFHPKASWRGPTPRWRSVTIDKGFSIRAK
jgi:hypothetical protein